MWMDSNSSNRYEERDKMASDKRRDDLFYDECIKIINYM